MSPDPTPSTPRFPARVCLYWQPPSLLCQAAVCARKAPPRRRPFRPDPLHPPEARPHRPHRPAAVDFLVLPVDCGAMISWLFLVRRPLTGMVRSRASLAAENAILRHQVAVLQRERPRPFLRPADRLLWIWLCRHHANLIRPISSDHPEWARTGVAHPGLAEPADQGGHSVRFCAPLPRPRQRWSLRPVREA